MDNATMVQVTDDWDEIDDLWSEDLCYGYFDEVISATRDGRQIPQDTFLSQDLYIQPVGLSTARSIFNWLLARRDLSVADQTRIREMFPVLGAN